MPGGPKSESQREHAALQLARGLSVAKAAAKTGIAARTIRLWLAEDATFAAMVRRLRGELMTRAISVLTSAGVKAARTLVEMTGKTEQSRHRIAAAVAILSQMGSGMKLVELEQRIADLEAKGAKP